MKDDLFNIEDVFVNHILPSIDGYFSDIDYSSPDDISINGMCISEYQSYLQNIEICSHLQMLTQIWEQQIVSTIYYSIGRRFYEEATYIEFKDAADCLHKHFGINVDKISSWQEITKIRNIVNVIKHAMGRSLEKVKKEEPDVVGYEHDENGKFDSVSFDRSSMLNITLDISLDKFQSYIKHLAQFWDEVYQLPK